MMVGLVVVGVGLLLFTVNERPAGWRTTTGTVNTVALNVANRECEPFAAYAVGGQTYSADLGKRGPFDSCSLRVGDTVTVHYNPKNPSDSIVYRPGTASRTGVDLSASIVVAAGVLLGLIGLLQARRLRRPRSTQLPAPVSGVSSPTDQ